VPALVINQYQVREASLSLGGVAWPWIEPEWVSTCIYLARCGDRIKVGRTTGLSVAVDSRMRELRRVTGATHEPLLTITKCANRHETFFHRILKGERVRGEYFAGPETDRVLSDLSSIRRVRADRSAA
jgi:hypothetical protein